MAQLFCVACLFYANMIFPLQRSAANSAALRQSRGSPFAVAADAVALARTCSSAERDAQRDRINFSESRCPSSTFISLIYETAIGCRDAVVVNVGANKGYVISEIAAIFAPQANVNPKRLGSAIHNFGLSLNNYSGCGVCNDCRSEPDASSASKCLGKPAHIAIHAFEPVPATVLLLRTALVPLLAEAPDISFTLHAAAVVRSAEITKSVPFEDCRHGDEVCSIKLVAGTKTVQVPTASLDLWASNELGNGVVIDLLLIDAEGYDPDVIRGAHSLLNSGRVRILQFEYNSGNLWETETLESTVSALDWHGYSCFLIGRASNAVLLTGCFEPHSMEKKAWSNVLCVRRSENATIAALISLTALGSHTK